jgi:AraC-like DNA-binding protein
VNGVYQDGREAVVSAGPVHHLRHHPSLRAALRRQLFADHPSDASEVSATAHRLVRCVDRDDLLQRSPARTAGLRVPARHQRTIDHVDPATATRLLDQALDLVAMAFADRMQQRSPDQSSHRSALLYRLKNYILTQLRDPELSMPRAAAAIGISPRYASDLMAAEQTSFRSYVQVQRLERCRRDLSDPAQAARHISDIAFAWGFNDLAHFSRIFKQRFGASPREWREHPTQ